MAPTTLFNLFLCPLFLHFLLSSATTTIHDTKDSSRLINFPETQAQKLIKWLNLIPKDDINTRRGGEASPVGGAPPLMVEKPLKFPVIGGDSGTSIQDLGHHAGYYRLPHIIDARCTYIFIYLLGIYLFKLLIL
ncbi:unnamed protein product [Camellia sinensis]